MSKIPITTLGRTSLTVSRMGLGLAALGRPGYINIGHSRDLSGRYAPATMEEHTHEVLDAAFLAGIRYVDTARSYGRGEEFLGSWLHDRDISKADISIGSKWGYTYTANWQVKAEHHEVKDHSLPVFQQQWKETQANLGDYLGVYHIHSATLESGVLDRQDVLKQLAIHRNNGLYIGLSLSGTGQADTLKKALDVHIDGFPLFSSVQATWNILEPSLGPLLAEAHNAGMGVIIKEALANGRLTSRNVNKEFADKRAMLEEEATILETSQEALALAAVLAQPWVDVVLSGATTQDQLSDNLRAFDVPFAQADQDKLALLSETPAAYWGKRSELLWN
ncbi:MAG: aldo/keto reductase [Bacteroidia bacterium]|nr:aldo/keto reductase [Bacteroidia bacterium]